MVDRMGDATALYVTARVGARGPVLASIRVPQVRDTRCAMCTGVRFQSDVVAGLDACLDYSRAFRSNSA